MKGLPAVSSTANAGALIFLPGLVSVLTVA
jgi:hypothetical protein